MPKFAVVTGASSGIGAEFARQLSARGYNLMLVARRADRLQALSNSLTTECEIFTADLARKNECLRLADALADRRIDLFINNAGFGTCGSFLETDKLHQVYTFAIHLLPYLRQLQNIRITKIGFNGPGRVDRFTDITKNKHPYFRKLRQPTLCEAAQSRYRDFLLQSPPHTRRLLLVSDYGVQIVTE